MRKHTAEKENLYEDIYSYSTHKKRKRRVSASIIKFATIFVALFSCFSIVCGGVMIFIATHITRDLTTVTLTKSKTALGIREENNLDKSVTNILLFGVDSRETDYSGNSDAIIVLSVDGIHNKVKMTSILRDSKVYIDGYGYNKINSAYSLGGAELAIRTVNQQFDLNIEDYATINFGGMASLIDSLGGVDIEITFEESLEINNNIQLAIDDGTDMNISASDFIEEKAGIAHLNGNQAVAYGRIRMIDSDDERAKRQQKVLSSLISKAKEISKMQYINVFKEISKLCETSLELNDIIKLLPIVFTDFTIETLTIPGEQENAWGGLDDTMDYAWVYIYDTDLASQHIRNFIYEQ